MFQEREGQELCEKCGELDDLFPVPWILSNDEGYKECEALVRLQWCDVVKKMSLLH